MLFFYYFFIILLTIRSCSDSLLQTSVLRVMEFAFNRSCLSELMTPTLKFVEGRSFFVPGKEKVMQQVWGIAALWLRGMSYT